MVALKRGVKPSYRRRRGRIHRSGISGQCPPRSYSLRWASSSWRVPTFGRNMPLGCHLGGRDIWGCRRFGHLPSSALTHSQLASQGQAAHGQNYQPFWKPSSPSRTQQTAQAPGPSWPTFSPWPGKSELALGRSQWIYTSNKEYCRNVTGAASFGAISGMVVQSSAAAPSKPRRTPIADEQKITSGVSGRRCGPKTAARVPVSRPATSAFDPKLRQRKT